jgi:hypothetical protein
MAGFSNITGDESIMFANNASFDGSERGGKMTTNGQLWIGSTASPHVKLGSLTSPNGTITIGYSSPNVTLDLVGGTTAIDSVAVDTTTGGGTNPVLPTAAGLITLTGGQYPTGTFGTRVVDINSSAANTIQVLLQQSSAVAATDSTKNGIAHFNSAEFSVDSNGFVSIKNGGFIWNDVTTATQTLAIQNGYVTDRGGGVTYTLPATASLGDEIRIVGKAGLATITPNVNQQIVISSANGTVGATGTAVATNAGDCMDLICITAGASTVWRAANFVGNWTLN